MDRDAKVIPSCLLCSSQENYCFNSAADVFGLIEINQRKKGVSRWLSNLVFLDRVTLKKESTIFICEIHYAKEDLVRVTRNNMICSVKLVNEQVVPCFVKLEERALNNRINSFMFLMEDYEKCLNLGKKWMTERLNKKFSLILEPEGIKIKIEDNLLVSLWENATAVDIQFAIDAGYIEVNKRIFFWSRLRGLMKYFEEKGSSMKEVVRSVPQKLPSPKLQTVTLKVTETVQKSPEKIKDDIVTNEIKMESQNILLSKNEDMNFRAQNLHISLNMVDNEPPAFKIFKLPHKQEKLVCLKPKITYEGRSLKNNPNNATPPFLTKTKFDEQNQQKNGDNQSIFVDLDPHTIGLYTSLVTILSRYRPPKWLVVTCSHGVCALEIVLNPSRKPYILKALKANKNLYITAYINGKNVVNNVINKTPGQVSKKELLVFMQSINKVPIKFPQENNPFDPQIKQEKLHLDDLTPGSIPTFDALVDSLSAFSGNDWHPMCINEKNALIFKVDISGLPKFKRYININRNLEINIFNNDRVVELSELIRGPFVWYPLTLNKIHTILALLDETVFEAILRPSKYRSKYHEEGMISVKYGRDNRVMQGTMKKHKCSVCMYESDTLNYVKQHYEIKHTPPDRKCPECGKEMNETQLKIHARFHIKKVSFYKKLFGLVFETDEFSLSY